MSLTGSDRNIIPMICGRLISLVIISKKFMKAKLLHFFCRHFPKQKRVYRLISYKAVKKYLDLLLAPNKFPPHEGSKYCPDAISAITSAIVMGWICHINDSPLPFSGKAS